MFWMKNWKWKRKRGSYCNANIIRVYRRRTKEVALCPEIISMVLALGSWPLVPPPISQAAVWNKIIKVSLNLLNRIANEKAQSREGKRRANYKCNIRVRGNHNWNKNTINQFMLVDLSLFFSWSRCRSGEFQFRKLMWFCLFFRVGWGSRNERFRFNSIRLSKFNGKTILTLYGTINT